MSDEQVNILLVDDQKSNLLALESILEEMGLNCVKAESGSAALRHLLQHDFAVVLLDVQMPDLDGFETASLIRERDRSRHTPIIFLTALSRSESNVFRGYELGAVDYLFKPFHPEILRSKVNVFVELFRKREQFKRQAQELERLSRQNELILSAAAEGVISISIDGRATVVNPAAARMMGRPATQILEADVHALVHPVEAGVAACDPSECELLAVLHGEPAYEQLDDEFLRPDGTRFPVEYSASPIRDEAGELVGSVVIFRDATERRAAARAAEAERRYREAEAQNRAKDNFLATLSHELRTPMTSILGWVQFLRTGHVDEEELAEALRTIESSARLQARLIDDMLDVSRIILGKFQVDLRPIRIVDVVDAALATARPLAAERHVRLTSELSDRDTVIEGDANRIQQVIHNLLSNAIKFTPEGRHVDLRLDRMEDALRIRVKDEGEGIDPSFLPFVFDRLSQGEGPDNRGGLGLGLAIARHIVELHHGHIEADSEGQGSGATFTVTLPVPETAGRDRGAALETANH
jgi:PAS domain S-box-containing protein